MPGMTHDMTISLIGGGTVETKFLGETVAMARSQVAARLERGEALHLQVAGGLVVVPAHAVAMVFFPAS